MEQYQPSAPMYAPPAEPRRLNPFGVASLLVALLSAVGTFVLVALAAMLVANGAGETSSAMIVVGLLLILSIGVDLIALGLGVVGLFQAGKGKVSSIVGMLISGATAVTLIMLIVIGNSIR